MEPHLRELAFIDTLAFDNYLGVGTISFSLSRVFLTRPPPMTPRRRAASCFTPRRADKGKRVKFGGTRVS